MTAAGPAGSRVAVVSVSWMWRRRPVRRVRRRRFGRAGCLLWILAVILIVLLLAVVSGGFRLGTRSGLGGTRTGAVTAAAGYQP
jgi:hypothetical protein